MSEIKFKSRRPKPSNSRITRSTDDAEEDDAPVVIPVRNKKSAKQTARKEANTKEPKERERSLLRPDIALPQAAPQTHTTSTYSAEFLAQLKAATPVVSRKETQSEEVRSEMVAEVGRSGALLVEEDIPTESSIQRARAKREQVRITGVTTSDYLTLTTTALSTDKESRLVRDDQDDDESVFVIEESIPLGKQATKKAALSKKQGMRELIDQAEEASDNDMAWENDQINRGNLSHKSEAAPNVYRPAPIPAQTPLPPLSSTITRLTSELSALETSLGLSAAALLHNASEKAELNLQEKEVRDQVEILREKKGWADGFQEWAETMGGFFEEKFPALLSVEKNNSDVLVERIKILERRRYKMDADDVALFIGASIPLTFDKSEDADSVITTSTTTIQPLSSHLESTITVPQSQTTTKIPILSPIEQEDLALAHSNHKSSLEELFEDVKAAAFRDPTIDIIPRFIDWREKYRDDYEGAFGVLGLVGVLEYWIRVELAVWNPFAVEGLSKPINSMEDFAWYATVHQHLEQEADTVMSGIISTVLIPRLQNFSSGFDVFNPIENSKALGWIEECSYSLESKDSRFENLILHYLIPFQHALTLVQSIIAPHLSALSLPRNTMNPTSIPARERFLKRYILLLSNLMKWRKWAQLLRLTRTHSMESRLVGEGVTFDELVFRELGAKILLPVVEAALPTGGLELGKQIVKLLPHTTPDVLKRRLVGQE